MSSWPKDELRKIAETDDLHFSPFREDGVTVWNADICLKLLVDFSCEVDNSAGDRSGRMANSCESKGARRHARLTQPRSS